MPYILKEQRTEILEKSYPILKFIEERSPQPGELNYLLTTLVDRYLVSCKNKADRVRYSHLNEVVGVLECVKQEIYRQIIVPFEDKKKLETGDVYSSELL